MDYSDDSVQWLGSQATCPALDNLLSEASFKPAHPPDLFRTPREFHDTTRRSARYGSTNKASSFSRSESLTSPASSSTTSLSPFASASDSGRSVGTPDSSTPFNSRGLGGSVGGGTSSEYRTRHSRSSNPTKGGSLSVPDCDKFLNLLEKASARINDSIRQDSTISRDIHKRQPLSKNTTTASTRNAHVKRFQREKHHHHHSQSAGAGSVSEGIGIGKGKVQELVSLTDAPASIPGGSARIAKSFGHHLGHAGGMMDGNVPPRPSPEVMPPPPVPSSLKKDTVMAPTQVTTTTPTRQSDPLPHFPSKPPFVSLERASAVPSSTNFRNQHETITQNAAAPTPTPKLHSLLDPERRERRLKLERTISASLASFSSSSGSSFSGLGSSSSLSSSVSSSASHTSVPPAGQLNATAATTTTPRIHIKHHHQTRNTLVPLSQDGAANNNTRPPPLGMRRTNTFPLASRNTSDVADYHDYKVAKPAKQQKFRPPLLGNTQQSPPPGSSSSSSRNDRASSHRSSSPLKTLHETTTRCEEEVEREIKDEEMDEDLPVNSDADLSFGETVKFDIDMDALEEAMRQYD